MHKSNFRKSRQYAVLLLGIFVYAIVMSSADFDESEDKIAKAVFEMIKNYRSDKACIDFMQKIVSD